MYLATLASATSWPKRSSSDRILGAPHAGFSRDMRRIRSRISRLMRGRPSVPALDFHLQYSLNPWPCHRITVSGWTTANAERQFGQRRDSNTQKTRSRRRNLGRLTDCLQTASCCRSARFSTTKWALGMRIARRNSTHVFIMPISAPSFTVEIGNSSQTPDAEQMTQLLDSKRRRNYW